MKKEDITEKVEAALNSLEGIKRAEPSYFFESQLMFRLQQRATTAQQAKMLFKPAFAIGILTVFVALNLFAISSMMRNKGKQESNTGIESMVQEYQLGTSTLYDTNTR